MNELKPCPFMIINTNMGSSYCIGSDCAWWCNFAEDCSIPVIADILADSSICRNVWYKDGE